MKTLVIYHANCTDGFGAAFAAWCKLGDDAEYVPMHYGDPLPPIDGRDVYVLDFSFDKPMTEHILTHAKRFVWLDHHKSAFEMWAGEERNRCEQSNGRDYVLLDNNKSGALLAWEYFHPEKDVPDLIKCIDDRDRWVFKLQDSKALHAGLQLRKPWGFKDWLSLTPLGTNDWGRNINDVISAGRVALQVYDEQIKQSVRKAERCLLPATVATYDGNVAPSVAFDPLPGLAVNTPNNISEVGNELAKASGTYGLVWYFDSQTKRANCSLRSIGGYDVSAIAKAFGGGGHKNAAGFNIDMPTLLGWLK